MTGKKGVGSAAVTKGSNVVFYCTHACHIDDIGGDRTHATPPSKNSRGLYLLCNATGAKTVLISSSAPFILDKMEYLPAYNNGLTVAPLVPSSPAPCLGRWTLWARDPVVHRRR